jgi:hypothetical protein
MEQRSELKVVATDPRTKGPKELPMTEGAENTGENEALPEIVAPMSDEDEPAELEELEPVDPAELQELEQVDPSTTAHAKPEV